MTVTMSGIAMMWVMSRSEWPSRTAFGILTQSAVPVASGRRLAHRGCLVLQCATGVHARPRHCGTSDVRAKLSLSRVLRRAAGAPLEFTAGLGVLLMTLLVT